MAVSRVARARRVRGVRPHELVAGGTRRRGPARAGGAQAGNPTVLNCLPARATCPGVTEWDGPTQAGAAGTTATGHRACSTTAAATDP